MIHRGQLLVRDCGPSSKSYSSDAIGTEFRHDYAFVGIAEVDAHRYLEHIVRGFLQTSLNADLRFQTTDYCKRIAFHRGRSEEHTSELQSLMRISYAVFCLKKKNHNDKTERTKVNRRHQILIY